jgi:hypothetical protein
MNTKDLVNAVHFLRRVVVRPNEVDLLCHTVEALEKEIGKRVAKRDTPK